MVLGMRRSIAVLLLLSFLALLPVRSVSAKTALPPDLPGAGSIPGLEEINLGLGLIRAAVGKDCPDLAEAGEDVANYLMGQIFSKMHPVAAGLWFAKEFGGFTATKIDEAVVENGFYQYILNRNNYMRSKGLDPSKTMPQRYWSDFTNLMDSTSVAQPLFAEALSYVNRGDTRSFRKLDSQERHFGMAMMEFMYVDKVWRDQHMSTWDSISGWFSKLIYGNPLPYSFDQFNGTCKTKTGVRVMASWDPNAIEAAPAGVGESNWIRVDGEIEYTIFFENEYDKFGEYMVPAEDVLIKLVLDPNLDPETVKFGETSHEKTASVQVAFDPHTGRLNWLLQGINLPPNENPPEGEGWVTFRARPKANLASGTQIISQAEIVFDFNPPIVTDAILQTVDCDPPTVVMTPVAGIQRPGTVELTWTGHDNAGIRKYVVYGSRDGGPLQPWAETADTRVLVAVEDGASYGFAVEAVDYVGLSSGVPQSECISFQVKAPEQTTSGYQEGVEPALGWYLLGDREIVVGLSGGGTLRIPPGFLPLGSRLLVTEITDSPSVLDQVGGSSWLAGVVERLILLESQTSGEVPSSPAVLSLTLEPGRGLYRYDPVYGRLVPVVVEAGDPFVETQVSDLTCYAVLQEIAPEFGDVSPVHWAASFIELLAGKGIIEGFEDLSFCPEESLTREQAAKLLVLAAGVPGSLGAEDLPFADVGERWSRVYIGSSFGACVLTGYPDGAFKPSSPVSRAEFITMVMRAMGIDRGGIADLSDAGSHWAAPYLAAAINQGLIGGYPDGTLRPDASITRAEAAKLLVLAFWRN